MSSQGGEAWARNTMVEGNKKNAPYGEGARKEEKMKKWAKGENEQGNKEEFADVEKEKREGK